MDKLKKKICKLNKEGFKKHEDLVLGQLQNPSFYCKKCYRVAQDEKLLCSPKPL